MFESTNEGFDDQEVLLSKFSRKITDVYKTLVSSSGQGSIDFSFVQLISYSGLSVCHKIKLLKSAESLYFFSIWAFKWIDEA